MEGLNGTLKGLPRDRKKKHGGRGGSFSYGPLTGRNPIISFVSRKRNKCKLDHKSQYIKHSPLKRLSLQTSLIGFCRGIMIKCNSTFYLFDQYTYSKFWEVFVNEPVNTTPLWVRPPNFHRRVRVRQSGRSFRKKEGDPFFTFYKVPSNLVTDLDWRTGVPSLKCISFILREKKGTFAPYPTFYRFEFERLKWTERYPCRVLIIPLFIFQPVHVKTKFYPENFVFPQRKGEGVFLIKYLHFYDSLISKSSLFIEFPPWYDKGKVYKSWSKSV